ncbi:MAG: hypothetical protein PHT79_06620 [Syntrophomonadaceae bacterium]|nr:hypothetical protein [Syntrophomonadaceae bacterium]MDD3899425.1 hypothetical protein [Syntrophomonadaceae bacterium]MDD4549417.1 hypothetical protein [Syntrophomonadaceae bacterium]
MNRKEVIEVKDHDYNDPKLSLFLEAVRPEIKNLFNDLICKKGYEEGLYIFEQLLAELVAKVGLDAV